MYDPTVGRFLEEDPTEFQGKDLNFYRYADNSPTNATDPSGLDEYPVAPELDPQKSQHFAIVVNGVKYGMVTASLRHPQGEYARTVTRDGLYLVFEPDPNLGKKVDDFGWVQHAVHTDITVVKGGRQLVFTNSFYDNAALNGRIGAPSDPRQRVQPNDDRPKGAPPPWYGGPGNPSGTGPRGHSELNPLAQSSLFDRPQSDVQLGPAEEYVAQLVPRTGKGEVLFSYFFYVENGRIHGARIDKLLNK